MVGKFQRMLTLTKVGFACTCLLYIVLIYKFISFKLAPESLFRINRRLHHLLMSKNESVFISAPAYSISNSNGSEMGKRASDASQYDLPILRRYWELLLKLKDNSTTILDLNISKYESLTSNFTNLWLQTSSTGDRILEQLVWIMEMVGSPLIHQLKVA
jgi:hypothetical protein